MVLYHFTSSGCEQHPCSWLQSQLYRVWELEYERFGHGDASVIWLYNGALLQYAFTLLCDILSSIIIGMSLTILNETIWPLFTFSWSFYSIHWIILDWVAFLARKNLPNLDLKCGTYASLACSFDRSLGFMTVERPLTWCKFFPIEGAGNLVSRSCPLWGILSRLPSFQLTACRNYWHLPQLKAYA